MVEAAVKADKNVSGFNFLSKPRPAAAQTALKVP
jgi:hypothetical protein